MKNRAVFLDRDGTLIEEKEYLHRPEAVVIFPGAVAALKKLQDAGFKLILVTNQSGVGRGYFTLADVERVHAHLAQELARDGVRLAKIYIAPEAPDQPSRGRKPSPQFLFDARDEFGLDLAQSYMIGDKLIDLECGWNAGVKKSLLVRTGYGAEVERGKADQIKQAAVVDDLAAAAEWIYDEDISSHRAKLRAAREAKHLSENEAAKRIGISSACYYDLEGCASELFSCFSLKAVSDICHELEIDPKELFRDYAQDLDASPIAVAEIILEIQRHCRKQGCSLVEFEEKVGWRVSDSISDPARLLNDWCIDCLRDVCRRLGVDWFRVVASL